MRYEHLNRGRWVCGFAVAVLLLGVTAHGQNSIGDGRGLDNNLQTGSGGVNQAQQVQGLGGDNLVTGNVPGLGFFRDPVGYAAPGEFGDSLGSDDLFRFQAQSFGSNPAAGSTGLSINPTQAGVGVYRTFSSPGTGVSPALGGFSNRISQGNTNAYKHANLIVNANSLATGVAMGLIPPDVTAELESSRIRQADLLAITRQQDGRFMLHTASPLLGVRANAIGEQAVAAAVDQAQASGGPGGPGGAGMLQNRPVIGPHIHNALTAHDAPEAVLRDYVKQIETALFSPIEDYNAELGQDVYLDLLAKLDAKRRGSAPKDEPVVPSSSLVPSAEPKPVDGEGKAEPGGAKGAGAKGDADRRARGLPIPDQVPEAAGDPGGQAEPGGPGGKAEGLQSSKGTAEQLPATARLIETLDYDLPPLKTFAGDSEETLDKLLREGEADMAAERFFDAESKYRRAARLAEGNPLPSVGLIHAQLGAGQIRSASFNLRRLFELHPELIAARYGAPLLPGAERLKWIADEVERMSKIDRRTEALVVKGYLAYQRGDGAALKAALDLALERAPEDKLVSTLRGIWLGKQDTGAGQK